MTFAEASAYLLSLGNEVSAMKLGLENIRTLLAALGSPENNYYKVQVAGTNGKGSVCAFVGEICLTAGIRTGVYTSPHLSLITERIKIDGRDISPDGFAAVASQVRETAERLLAEGMLQYLPTFFEQVTAVALVAFRNAGVDLAVLETGLGGRLDATTAAGSEVAVITRIDLDHQEYLGDTLEEIAAEKAAIIHRDSQVVIGDQWPEALQVIIRQCEKLSVDPILSSDIQVTEEGVSLEFVTQKASYSDVELALRGKHQIENAKTAICTAEILQDRFSITSKDIVTGLRNVSHPGRLEWMGRFLLDGAHNPGGAKSLGDFLIENNLFGITLIFGAMRGKDARSMMDLLLPHVAQLVLTQPSNSRSATTDELLEGMQVRNLHVIRTSSVLEAIKAAKRISDKDTTIVVAGSLYLVGEARQVLLDRENETSC